MNLIQKIISALSLVILLSLCMGIIAFASVDGGSTVYVSHAGQTVDTIEFGGVCVPAKYTPGGGYGSSEYSCAALVMRFYKMVYGFDVWNLSSSGATPICSNGESFVRTDSPRVGDIVRFQDRTHWALVKSVSGSTVTIIEQNWGYYSSGGYVAAVNRTVKIGDAQVSFFTYSAYDNAMIKPQTDEAAFDTWEAEVAASTAGAEEQFSIESLDNLKMVHTEEQIENSLSGMVTA